MKLDMFFMYIKHIEFFRCIFNESEISFFNRFKKNGGSCSLIEIIQMKHLLKSFK